AELRDTRAALNDLPAAAGDLVVEGDCIRVVERDRTTVEDDRAGSDAAGSSAGADDQRAAIDIGRAGVCVVSGERPLSAVNLGERRGACAVVGDHRGEAVVAG